MSEPLLPALPAWFPLLMCAPVVGSFLGVLIRRLPRGRPVVLGRSACEHCGTALSPIDLVPLLSFALCRGHCRHCGARVPPFHLAIELIPMMIVVAAAAIEPDPGRLWLDCALGWTLLTLAWIDWDWLLLPDALTLPLLLGGLGVTLFLDPRAVADHAAAAIAGYCGLQGLGMIYHRLRKREGLGGGDAKLLAAAGAWLGLAALPWVLLLAAVAGLLAALAWALTGRQIERNTALPFGPWLALAIWLMWTCGVAGRLA